MQFFRPDLIFSFLPGLSSRKKFRDIKKYKNTTMTEPPPPPPRSPDYAPREVTQDFPFEGHDNNPISHPPDEGFDDWSPADTSRIVAMSGCDDERLKSCIIAASASIWGVNEMYPAQLDTVCHLIHPLRPNHLAVSKPVPARLTSSEHLVSSSSLSFLFLSLCSHFPPMSCLNLLAPIKILVPSPYKSRRAIRREQTFVL